VKVLKVSLILAAVVLILAGTTLPSLATTYMLTSQWGGTWHDANKTYNDDSLMCWAAAASNVLDWGSWDTPTFNTETKILQDIKNHWTDNRGWQSWAWNWWLSGADAPYHLYAYENVQGGGYFPGTSFYSNYSTAFGSSEMATMDALMNKGYGISLVIGPNHTNQHAITCWGYDYVMNGTTKQYTALYITDSDDGVTALKKMNLTYSAANGWYFTDGYTNWNITGVYAFKKRAGVAPGDEDSTSDVTAPIAPTWMLFSTGLGALGFLRLRQRRYV
jgi:hypothetical protein